MHSTTRILAAVPLAAALLSCGGGDGPTPPPPPPPVDLTVVATIAVSAPAPTVVAGTTLLLSAQATNANGGVLGGQTFTWSTNSTATATVQQDGTVLGVAPGTVVVSAAVGVKTGSVTLTVTPAPAPASIAISSGNGQTANVNAPVAEPPSVIVRDAAGAPISGVTVTFEAGGGSSATGTTQTTSATGVATVGSWTMGPTPGVQTLTATSGTLTGSPVTFTATAIQPSTLRQFNAQATSACTNPSMRTGRVEAESEHLTIVADVDNPAGGFTASDYQIMASTFESLVWPVLTETFGRPADIDGGGRVIAFFTRAVNELTLAGAQGFVGGFFFARDLFPKVSNAVFVGCPGSNEAEMFYILAPDPTGTVNGNVRATADVRRIAVSVIGHEMQHLINSSRRLFINTFAAWPEDVFMEEGLSHIAEELLFYEASGIAPRSNVSATMLQSSLTAANNYAIANLARFSLYLKSPSANSPYTDDDALAIRGATWSWLRYLADRGSASPSSGTACGAAVSLDVNASCRLEGAAAGSFSIAGAAGSEYTIVAFADGASFSTSASATNAVAAVGPPNPARFPSGPRFDRSAMDGVGRVGLDQSFHRRLRAMERGLKPLVPHARARFGKSSPGGARFTVTTAPERPRFLTTAVEPVWGRLLNNNETGMNNLKREFGQAIGAATLDWAVANYVDDVVPALPSHYMNPSWNFRSVLPLLSSNMNAYPLYTVSLAGSAPIVLTDGGTVYYRMGVAAGTTSAVTFTVDGAVPPGNLKLMVVRTK